MPSKKPFQHARSLWVDGMLPMFLIVCLRTQRLIMWSWGKAREYQNVTPADVMSISRGCVYHCGFCETRKLWGNICRGFSPKRVVGEIKDLQSKYGTKGLYFINDNFTLRRKETLEL